MRLAQIHVLIRTKLRWNSEAPHRGRTYNRGQKAHLRAAISRNLTVFGRFAAPSFLLHASPS